MIPPQIEEDFRLTTVDKVYAFARKDCRILEEKSDEEDAAATGSLPGGGVCYILQEDEREIGIGSNNIKAVYVDEQKSLVYIGTHAGGLTVLHRNSGKMESFNQLNSQLVNENVYAILPDKGGNLLLGTLSALVSFNPEKKSFTTIDKEKDGSLELYLSGSPCSQVVVEGAPLKGKVKQVLYSGPANYIKLKKEALESVKALELYNAGSSPVNIHEIN